ncbi:MULTISPECIES: hypothetical protein [unclassified Kribbella]|uniref:hypothetical protein n=1 Tax=unclassified Kribbella TaxID=2644121 RepID=UPI0033D888CB
MTQLHVEVVRVFTDPDGRFGNPLGIVDGAAVQPGDRQRVAAGDIPVTRDGHLVSVRADARHRCRRG